MTVSINLCSEMLSPSLAKSSVVSVNEIIHHPSSSVIADASSKRAIEDYGLLDLYSSEAFLTVLHTPRIYDSFAAFLRTEHSSENLAFWSRCEEFKRLRKELSTWVTVTEGEHLLVGSEYEINVLPNGRIETVAKMENLKTALTETQEDIERLRKEVEIMMWRDSYPRFLKHHLAYNARRSLQYSPGKTLSFKGLGECFCLTDPRKPDNPIVLCSDGFIQVTGFPVERIVNHNCRFLQGSLSDPTTIGRIRTAIKEGRESTEVFLNYRQDGTPFWNLLLIAPLKDETSNIRYFFGAQVDVSSLFHRNNDLSAILSQDFALPAPSPTEIQNPRKSFFRRLSEKTRFRPSPVISPSVGLVEEVVREDITTIGEQVDVFRSAYAKYILVDNTGNIQFCSERAGNLFPGIEPFSQPIFPILSQTFSNVDSRTIRKLQRALNSGQATSIRLTSSPPTTPSNESFINLTIPEESETRSRKSSNATSSTSNSDPSLVRGNSGEPTVVAIHMTPLKNGEGKAEMFVFVLAGRLSDV